MKIRSVEHRSIGWESPIRNAYIDFSEMTTSVVRIVTDRQIDGEPVVGYGFSSNGRYAVDSLLTDRFIPRLLRADPRALCAQGGDNLDPEAVWATLMRGEKPGGHGERAIAIGALDMAVWDIVAKIERKPLFRVLADRYRGGQATDPVFVYAAGGYAGPDHTLQSLTDELRGYLDLGYTMAKIKIGIGSLGDDLARIEAALTVLPAGSLAVDANGRLRRDEAAAYAAALEPYGLRWWEEPCDPLDYELMAAIASWYAPPLATGENLFSTADVTNLVRYGGLRADRDVLQFDCALSYGLPEYLRTLQAIEDGGWSRRQCIPHGGHHLSLHIAAGLGIGGSETYPTHFRPFSLFATGTRVIDGHVSLSDEPGLGHEAVPEVRALLYKQFGPVR